MVRQWVPAVVPAIVVGGVWWWAVLRLVLAPGDSGPLEGAVAIGGWGLSLLPIHVVAIPGRRPPGGRPPGRWSSGGRPSGGRPSGGHGAGASRSTEAWSAGVGSTRAWRRRR
ncbi:hypothetical protein OG584_08105 [Streptomyces sp. NBC_00859]|nr:hypothetical protein OG584_08105 [Streptomyces sp. NBC_00859]